MVPPETGAMSSPAAADDGDSSSDDDAFTPRGPPRLSLRLDSVPRAMGARALADARSRDDVGDSEEGDDDDGVLSPTLNSHLSRLRMANALIKSPAAGGWRGGGASGNGNGREMLLIARNAREQAKENVFLRARVKELEDEAGERDERIRALQHHEKRAENAKATCVALKAHAAAHAAAAEQLARELERTREIETQSSLEAVALAQKTTKLQNEVRESARRAALAEEMMLGMQHEGIAALEQSEETMRRLRARITSDEKDENAPGDAPHALRSARPSDARGVRAQGRGHGRGVGGGAVARRSVPGRPRARRLRDGARARQRARGGHRVEGGERVPSRGNLTALREGIAAEEQAQEEESDGVPPDVTGEGNEDDGATGGEEEKAEGGGGEDARAATPPRAKRQPTPRKKWGSPSFSKRSREMDKENVTKFRNMNGVVVDVLTTTTT